MDKIMVQRANVILEISPEDKERFMEQGYSVIDANGKVLEEALPKDVNALQKLVTELKAKVAEKDEEIAKLKKASTKSKVKESAE